jgi:hypothetical protein
MPEELRTISMETLPDLIRLLNQTSRGTSLEYHLDLFSFLALKRYWNFSYDHSLIRYVDGEAAALILVCTDPVAHDAYTFYWGTLSKFRDRRLSVALFDSCCAGLRQAGFDMLYGVTVPDRPISRYRFIQAYPQHQLADLEGRSIQVPASDAEFRVQKLEAGALARFPFAPGERFHWCQRPAFVSNIAPFIQIPGSFAGEELKAYAVVSSQPSGTTILDLRAPESDATSGHELLRWMKENCAPPFVATNVFDQSPSHRLLTEAGLTVTRRFHTLTRDLRATS